MYIADELKKYFKRKLQELKDYTYTGVSIVDPAVARETSSKAVYPTTYDRYEKYHHPVGTEFKLGKVIDNVCSTIKKVINAN